MPDLKTINEYLDSNQLSCIKLHLGCGGVRWKNFINIDYYPYSDDVSDTSRTGCVADAYADMLKLDLATNSVDEIFTSHTFEHFTKWQGTGLLADLFRILKPAGKLVVETPDFWRCVFWLFHPSAEKRRLGRTQFYGNQWDRLEYETHRYLWTAKEIVEECRLIGYSKVQISHKTETHHQGRDMRLVAWK